MRETGEKTERGERERRKEGKREKREMGKERKGREVEKEKGEGKTSRWTGRKRLGTLLCYIGTPRKVDM